MGLRLVRSRRLSLIQFDNRWDVAYKATGRLSGEDGKVLAWLRDFNDEFICKVNSGEKVYGMPVDPETNFYGDQFNFSVEEVDEFRRTVERLAGATNVSAARAALAVYIQERPIGRRYILRKSGRIILEAKDGEVLP